MEEIISTIEEFERLVREARNHVLSYLNCTPLTAYLLGDIQCFTSLNDVALCVRAHVRLVPTPLVCRETNGRACTNKHALGPSPAQKTWLLLNLLSVTAASQ